MICEKCGQEMANDARFCCHCGAAAVKAAPAEESVHEPKKQEDAPVAGIESSGKAGEAAAGTAMETGTSSETVMTEEPVPAEDPASEEATPGSESQGDYNAPPCSNPIETAAPERRSTPAVPVGLRILSALLCVILLVLSTGASAVGIARTLLNSEKAAEMLADIRLSEVLIEGVPLTQVIYDRCDEEIKTQYGLTEEKIRRILERADLEDFTEKVAEPFFEYLFGETNRLRQVDVNAVVDAVRENEDLIYDITGYRMTPRDYYVIEEQLTELLDSVESRRVLDEAVPFALRFMLGHVVLLYAALIALSVVLLILILLANRFRIKETSLHLGITFLVEGLLFCGAFFGLFGFYLSNGNGAGALLAPFLTPTAIRFGGYILIGVAFLILWSVLRKRAGKTNA